MSQITRRQLFKLAAGAAGAAIFSPLAPAVYALDTPTNCECMTNTPPSSLGRIATWGVEIREQPKRDAKLVRVARRDEVLPLYEQVDGDALMSHNAVWYKVEDGYAYSSWVQPVENILNAPEAERAAEKFWGELTVPFSDTYWAADPKARRSVRLYYTGVFRVVAAAMGKDEQWWYRLQEGVMWGPGPYVPAAHIRRFDPSELTPLSPEVTNKRIEISLKTQTITAYENDALVQSSKIASGFGVNRTPSGKHRILFKNPTARMIGGEGQDAYDLPGVAFPTFFTWKGVAIHGTYWHNDYGRPRSHGCVNVPSLVARWFWRWTAPVAPYENAIYYTPKDVEGTLVVVS